MKTPFFSIIIPCFNSEKTISRAMVSVYIQTFKDYEVIIIDDGSSDNTKKLITDFLESKEVKNNWFYFYKENKGPSVARNNGAKKARGQYLAFLDADDEWHPRKLEIQYDIIKKYSSLFCACNYQYGDSGNTDCSALEIKKYFFKDFVITNRTSTPCVVIEKDFFFEIGGFDERKRFSEDYRLWLDASYKEPLIKIISPKLVKLHKYAYGEKGLSSNLWEMEKGELKNYIDIFKKGYISIFYLFILIPLSLIKFCKRLISVKLKLF